MGCTNSNTIQQELKILPLPNHIVNSYIDRLPIIFINKLKSKFESHLKAYDREIKLEQFLNLMSKCQIFSQISSVTIDQYSYQKPKANLFYYFNNNQQKKLLSLSLFIQKYCILIKSNIQHFSQIIHRIYCKNVQAQLMSSDEFNLFKKDLKAKYFLPNQNELQNSKFPLKWNQFYDQYKQKIKWQQLQKDFQVIMIDQIPFKKISQQLKNCINLQYIPGDKYYILSSEWFNKWIYFYQFLQENQLVQNSHFRSVTSSKRVRRGSMISQQQQQQQKRFSSRKMNSSKLLNIQQKTVLSTMQPPTQIDFQNIQGEYSGQLRPFISIDRDITIVNANLWKMLKDLLQCKQQFQRIAVNQQSVDIYPISIYFYKTDKQTDIKFNSLKIIRVNGQTTGKMLYEKIRAQQCLSENENSESQIQQSVFIKTFGSLQFQKWDFKKSINQMTLQQLRIIVVQTQNPEHFIQKFSRTQIKLQNLCIGDKVSAYFSFQDKFCPAYIMQINPEKQQIKCHYIGVSYKYQRWVKKQNVMLSPSSQTLTNEVFKFTKQQLFSGISNIGNTCFMNSVLQALASTSIFSKFLSNHQFSQQKQPLNYCLAKVIKGLIFNKEFNIYQLKRIVNNKLPMFSGYDQHDSQQFLNLLLDKMSQQFKQKPTIIDQLFSGIMESKFTCLKCNQTKSKQEEIHSISLPVPEMQYNYYKIVIFPIYTSKIIKMVLRLHKNAKVSEYLYEMESRNKIMKQDFIYVQSSYRLMRKFRNQLIFEINQNKHINDFGFTNSSEVWAFQKFKSEVFQQILQMKTNIIQRQLKEGYFYDYFSNQQTAWGICKVIKIKQQQIDIQFLRQNNILKNLTLKRQQKLADQFHLLGSKLTQKNSKKISMRKFDNQTKKMERIDYQFLITLPRWASYNDINYLIHEYLQNMLKTKGSVTKSNNSSLNFSDVKNSKKQTKNQSFYYLDQASDDQNKTRLNRENTTDLVRVDKLSRTSRNTSQLNENHGLFQKERLYSTTSDYLLLTPQQTGIEFPKPLPYIIHYFQPTTNCCFFCQKQMTHFQSAEEIKSCCQPEQKDVPLYWVGKQKLFYFFIDWKQMDQYNETFCNQIYMDNSSLRAQEKIGTQKITLQSCLDLFKKPEKIEMSCQKCKFQQHLLQTSIKKAPIITVFHLKQFKYTSQGHFVKIDVNLEWKDGINLQKYCADNQSSMFEMFSVIEHSGSTSFGHYTAKTKRKHPYENKKVWIKFDDDQAKIIEEIPQVINNAYLLFFKKVQIPSSAIVKFSI